MAEPGTSAFDQDTLETLVAYFARRRKRSSEGVSILFHMLWDEGKRRPMGIEKICRNITKANGWGSDGLVGSMEDQKNRLRKRAQRLNMHMRKQGCPYKAWIAYRRDGQLMELLTDPEEIGRRAHSADDMRQTRGQSKVLRIAVLSAEHAEGVPVLKVGDTIQCRLMCPIAGYLHMFHVDANNLTERMFPSRGAKKTTVRTGKTMCFPEDFLKEGFESTVGKASGKKEGLQHVVAVVSRLDVKLSECDLESLGIGLETRGVINVEPTLKHCKPGGLALGLAQYQMRNT